MSRRIKDYYLGPLIGKGSFADVKYAVNYNTGERIACKIISSSISQQKLDLISYEIKICSKLIGCPYIVQFKDEFREESKLYLFFELCVGGDLLSKIHSAPIREHRAKLYFMDMLTGLRWMHSKGIVHRDLKPENCLIDEDDTLKLSDFGLAAQLQYKDNEEKLLTDFVGTRNYAAPEVLKNTPYLGKPADIWACGVILFTMVSGKMLFFDEDDDALTNRILRGDVKYPDSFTRPLKELLVQLLVVDPKRRLTVLEILNHRWLPTKNAYGTGSQMNSIRVVQRSRSTQAPTKSLHSRVHPVPASSSPGAGEVERQLSGLESTAAAAGYFPSGDLKTDGLIKSEKNRRKISLFQIDEEVEEENANHLEGKKKNKNTQTTHRSPPEEEEEEEEQEPPIADAFKIIGWTGVFDITRILQDAIGPTNIKNKTKTQFISETKIKQLMETIYNFCSELPEVKTDIDRVKFNITVSDCLDIDGHIQFYSLAPNLYLVDFVQLEGDTEKWFTLFRDCHKICK